MWGHHGALLFHVDSTCGAAEASCKLRRWSSLPQPAVLCLLPRPSTALPAAAGCSSAAVCMRLLCTACRCLLRNRLLTREESSRQSDAEVVQAACAVSWDRPVGRHGPPTPAPARAGTAATQRTPPACRKARLGRGGRAGRCRAGAPRERRGRARSRTRSPSWTRRCSAWWPRSRRCRPRPAHRAPAPAPLPGAPDPPQPRARWSSRCAGGGRPAAGTDRCACAAITLARKLVEGWL